MKPAANIASGHDCDVHGPGMVGATPGATGVLVNGEKMSVLGDITACQAVVAEGAALVLARGLPAVHLGHATLHGGQVVLPLSADVLIGGPTFALPENFVVEGSPAFQNKVLRDLFFLSQTKNGREVIDRMAASGKTVTFRDYADRPPRFPPPFPQWPDTSFAVPDPLDASPGVQNDVVIYFQPDPSVTVVWSEAGTNVSTTTSPQVNLFHEMVHGMHITEGDAIPPEQVIPGHDPKNPYQKEEARTIGDHAEGWGNEKPSENSLRDELGMPRRRDINTPNFPLEDHVPGPTDHRPGDDP